MKEQEEVVEEANDCELLVFRRALSNLKGDQEEQRENIFHSRCTVQGKVCSLIIDGGSCDNIASLSIVENLNYKLLPTLTTSNGLIKVRDCKSILDALLPSLLARTIMMRFGVTLIPMDAYHMLLGRPWLFDLRVMHDGYLNT